MAKAIGSPKPYLRNLKNERKIETKSIGWGNPGSSEQAEAWGGLFWDIRTELGSSVADRLIFSTRIGLKDGAVFRRDDFARALLEKAKGTGLADKVSIIQNICERRGVRP